jgi:MFS family permease
MARRPDRRILALGAVGVLSGLPGIDAALHTLALPIAASGFEMTARTVAVATHLGTVMLVGCLLGAGVLGDRLGRRRMLLGGTLTIAIGALLTAGAEQVSVFLLGRALTGIGTAAVLTMTAAMLPALFGAAQLPAVFGIWLSAQAVTVVAGALVGGALLDAGGWRSAYQGTAVLAGICMVPAWLTVPAVRVEPQRDRDTGGVLLAGTGSAVPAAGFGWVGVGGWTNPAVLGALVYAAPALLGFARRERRKGDPAFPVRLAAAAPFPAACLTAVAVAVAGMAWALSLSPLLAGRLGQATGGVLVLAIPAVLGAVLGAVLSASVQEHGTPARTVLVSGLLCCGLGTVILSSIEVQHARFEYAIVGTLIGFGMSWALNPAASVIMAGVPSERAGSVAAAQAAAAQLGGAIVLVAVPKTIVTHPDKTPGTGAAYVHGLACAMPVVSVLLIASAVVVALMMRGHRTRTAAEAAHYCRYRQTLDQRDDRGPNPRWPRRATDRR